jgi:thymidylate synthase (FAD)
MPFLPAKPAPVELYEKVNILDKGSAALVEHWGHDERIIEAARMSTGKGFVSWDPYEGHPKGDAGLLEYLYTHKHGTPFEMAGMIIEIQAPIMVFREWHRHRTQSYNEMSARYTPLPDVNYIPTVERCLMVPGNTKQAASVVQGLTHESVLDWLTELEKVYVHAEEVYQSGLARGIPKELARLPVPVGRYSRMVASANLRNWLAFLTLRMDTKAQYEIRMFANKVGEYIQALYPRTWALFVK